MPQDQRFWDDLYREARKWGLEMYEQDWLDVQYLKMKQALLLHIDPSFGFVLSFTFRCTRRDFSAAATWLLQMGSGATRNNIDIKLCMSLPRQVLASAQIESVNAARVSGDYRLSKDNWVSPCLLKNGIEQRKPRPSLCFFSYD